jgi:hypothetical protein
MSKQKAFKRKLAKPHHGFRYYRIWGWPLSPDNVPYHQERYGNDPGVVIFNHPTYGWLRLYVEECHYQNDVRSRFPNSLNGSLGDRYFKIKRSAVRVLVGYAKGIRHTDLANMVGYHKAIDAFGGIH